MASRSRIEKLNRTYLARFRGGEEAAFLQTGTVDRIKDKEIPGFHIRLRQNESQWAWANSKLTFTIGSVYVIDPDKARSIALGIKVRVTSRKGVEPVPPAAIRSWIETEIKGVPLEPVKPGWPVIDLRQRFLAFKGKDGTSAATLRNYKSALNALEINDIGNRRAADITSTDIVRIRDGVALRGDIQSNRVLAALSSMFTYAKGEPESQVKTNPCFGVNRVGKESERERHLPWHELKRFIRALPEAKPSPGVACAMLWTLATAQRKRANREVKKVDISNGIWSALTKKKGGQQDRRALIPVTPLMSRVQQLAARYCRADSVWLFPSDRTSYKGIVRDVPIAESALNNVIARLCADAKDGKEINYKKGSGKYKLRPRQPGPLCDLEKFTVHDFRRTATTLCRDEGIARSDASALLDHDDDDGSAATITGRVYDQHEPIPARQTVLEKWHDILGRVGIQECIEQLESQWQKVNRIERPGLAPSEVR